MAAETGRVRPKQHPSRLLMATEKSPFLKKSLKGQPEMNLLMLLDASGESFQEEKWKSLLHN